MSVENPTEFDVCVTIATSGIFDTEWYLSKYHDVAESDFDPIIHYVRHGEKEKRRPNPNFNPEDYQGKIIGENILYSYIITHNAII